LSARKGYEKHWNKYRVKVTGEDGKRGYVSFDTPEEAERFNRLRGSRRVVDSMIRVGGYTGAARAARTAMVAALSDERETPTETRCRGRRRR
jgi:hypothetical protein